MEEDEAELQIGQSVFLGGSFGGVLGGVLSGGLGLAAGAESKHHAQSHKQSNDLFHSLISSEIKDLSNRTGGIDQGKICQKFTGGKNKDALVPMRYSVPMQYP